MDAVRYRALRWMISSDDETCERVADLAGLGDCDGPPRPEHIDALADAAITLAPADVVGSVWKPIETPPAEDGVYLLRTPAQKEINAAESVNYRKGDDYVWCARGDYYCFDGVPGCEWTEIPK